MTKTTILIILLVLVLLVGGGLYCGNKVLTAFRPAKINITKTEISSSEVFVNPITIEKLKVDSIGQDQRPVKYTIKYLTTCGIKQKSGKPPIPLNKIKLDESGRYGWTEEIVNIPVIHADGYSQRIDSAQRMIWSMGKQKFDICPLRFEKDTWYFINILDPQIIGVYVYIDDTGMIHQYTTYSGVSPI